MRFLFIFIFIFTSINSYPQTPPSWVEGVRNGSESLKVINGNKFFFRRIAGNSDLTKTASCDQAVAEAKEDVDNEFYLYTDVPFTVEVLFYDEKNKDCAVTVSVPQTIPDKYLKLNQWKKDQKEKEAELNSKIAEAEEEKRRLEQKQRQLENYIQKNAHIINKVNKLEQTADTVEGMLQNRQSKAERFAYTGLHEKEFEKAIGESVSVSLSSYDPCYKSFSTFYNSSHGNIVICWDGNNDRQTILGFCKRSTGYCYTKSP